MSQRHNGTDEPANLSRQERLKRDWSAGNITRFWATVTEELIPEMVEQLDFRFRRSSLSLEDIEDSCQDALLPFMNGQAGHVSDPELYIWKAARFACIDRIRERKRRPRTTPILEGELSAGDQSDDPPPGEVDDPPVDDGDDQTLDDGDDLPIDKDDHDMGVEVNAATLIVEEAVPEVDAGGGWATDVVRDAMTRLPPGQRRVVQYEMDYGFEARDERAADDLGMKPKSYRAAKSKAFSALWDIIPQVINDLGITPPPAAEEAIFGERRDVPSDDDGEGAGDGPGGA